jgi:hypothetical protein
MKKLMVTMLMLAGMSGFAMAQDFVGIFADMDGLSCDAVCEDYVAVTVYVMAYIPTLPDGITAAEFSIPSLPANLGYPDIQVIEDWESDLIIGDVRYDLSIAFPDPIYGPYAYMGSIAITEFNPAFGLSGPDFVMAVMPGGSCECLQVVDNLFNTLDVMGGIFTFNCTTGDCICLDSTATEDTSWSAVKALF